MVYRASEETLRGQFRLDPHFCEHSECLSPFARFAPTKAGWKAALSIVRILSKEPDPTVKPRRSLEALSDSLRVGSKIQGPIPEKAKKRRGQ